MSVLDKVKSRAEAKGTTIKALEAETGLANGTIYGWDKSKPYAESLQKVAAALNCKMEDLMPEEE